MAILKKGDQHLIKEGPKGDHFWTFFGEKVPQSGHTEIIISDNHI